MTPATAPRMLGAVARKLAFRKVEGLGNDFVLIDCRAHDEPALASELARMQRLAPRLCDRHTGIGGDGILLVGPGRSQAGAASMIVVNFDGSRPEMCGNGLRCVAAFVAAQTGSATQSQPASSALTIDTDAGARRCEVWLDTPTHARVQVEMGPARRLGRAQPDAGDGHAFIGVSMGNPHAVCFVDEDPEPLARRLGPGIELDPVYAPGKTNVEFARLEADASVRLWVWERGVGITSACGTGACATAVAAVDAGLAAADTPITVHLPGGALTITVPRDHAGEVTMLGPAREVFVGELELDP